MKERGQGRYGHLGEEGSSQERQRVRKGLRRERAWCAHGDSVRRTRSRSVGSEGMIPATWSHRSRRSLLLGGEKAFEGSELRNGMM